MDEIRAIRDGGITPEIVKSVITKFEPKRSLMKRNYERYKASRAGVPVLTRRVSEIQHVNNRINNDFFSEIVDIKTGYFAGNAVSYNYDKARTESAQASPLMYEFTIRNNMSDLDGEATRLAAIAGYCPRMMYLDNEGQGGQERAVERVMNLQPWEAVILSETTIAEPEFAFRVYEITDPGRKNKRIVEFWDEKGCEVFKEGSRGNFQPDPSHEANGEHRFGLCPIWGIPNNEELQGDADKVIELIDAYDRTLSDANSEIEAFRSAYMAFKGGTIDEETLRLAREEGAFNVPDGGDVYFITKQIQDGFIENHLNRLHDSIYRFSKTPDLADQAFGGNVSGVAMKFKLFSLESKCTTFERKFNSAAMYMFRLWSGIMQVKGRGTFDPLNVFMEYKRNFPLDLLHEAQVQATLKGMVSEQTRLSLAGFIDDPEYEIQQLEGDLLRMPIPNLDNNGGDNGGGQDQTSQNAQGADGSGTGAAS